MAVNSDQLRTLLANERTLLAYVRTALALIITGLGAVKLFHDQGLMVTAGWIAVAAGAIVLVVGILVSYERYRAIRRGLGLMLLAFFCADASFSAVVETRKSEAGWELLVDGEPYFVKGMIYWPTSIAESSDNNTRRDWMMVDDDEDGRNDFAYQTWVDANRNNIRDEGEEEVGDFALMKSLGVNTIRVYHSPSDDFHLMSINAPGSEILNHAPNKELLRALFRDYGIRVAMGDFLGAYTVATGAAWEKGTDYTDPVQRANMLKSVEAMVRAHKDEPYLLFWILGNENNFKAYTNTNAAEVPEVYAAFVNEAAELIHKLDPHHPVALCNGGDAFLDVYNRLAPAVDIFGTNMYQNNGFHPLWKKAAEQFDRPVLLTEFGTGHPMVKDGRLNEKYQALIHRRSWEDMVKHRHGQSMPGNAIGGFVFEFVDEWWFNGAPETQNTNPDGSGWNIEYNGLASMGDGRGGSLMRQLRDAYATYRALWQNESAGALNP